MMTTKNNANYDAMSKKELIMACRPDAQGMRDAAAIEKFTSLYGKRLLKVAESIARSYRGSYDHALGFDGLTSDSHSEGWLAIMQAIDTYDFEIGTFEGWATLKIQSHFQSLKRKNSKHTEHEFNVNDPKNRESDIAVSFSLDCFADESNEDLNDIEQQDYVNVLRNHVAEKLGESNATMLDELYNAFTLRLDKPFDYVAKKMGITRQTVYNKLKAIRKSLPVDLAEELKYTMAA